MPPGQACSSAEEKAEFASSEKAEREKLREKRKREKLRGKTNKQTGGKDAADGEKQTRKKRKKGTEMQLVSLNGKVQLSNTAALALLPSPLLLCCSAPMHLPRLGLGVHLEMEVGQSVSQ